MPRYFFDLTDRQGFHRDEFGVEFANAQEARDQAVCLLPDVARLEMPNGDQHDIRVQMRDKSDTVIYDATLSLRAGWTSQAKR